MGVVKCQVSDTTFVLGWCLAAHHDVHEDVQIGARLNFLPWILLVLVLYYSIIFVPFYLYQSRRQSVCQPLH
jgi:hypothetical protein